VHILPQYVQGNLALCDTIVVKDADDVAGDAIVGRSIGADIEILAVGCAGG
jgi:hypothetical protein